MDFEQISKIQKTRQDLEKKRQENAEKALENAFQKMAEAFEQSHPSKKKACLLDACEAFAEALKQQRSNPEIYIGMAYLLITLHEHAQALNYLQEAERLAPQHPDIHKMRDYLAHRPQTNKTQPQAHALVSASLSPLQKQASENLSEADFDRLYEETETQLQTLLKAIQAEKMPLRATLEIAQTPDLKNRYQHYLEQTNILKSDLDLLDQEFEISELEQNFSLLNIFLKRCQKLLSESAELLCLYTDLKALLGRVTAQLKSLTAPNTPLPDCESLLDQCDSLADRLDELENKGYELTALLAVYEKIVESLEDLQNNLDELNT
ncbi:hypothetical protein COW36_16150 [bacterium (Candidatus Blackallbacteria) CG17_big_fil_post_rev_8_21_14_2_50_48_46]|uniref:Uncharacterized protein n=1 Tax=bacterium (Candidatus Blackallbacteria) CG17_big_fil_post_rev_8_21_14_2_50_48_46 TaxID=2014261 RepID=A0A2M7G1U9_9BACT|nr:MAG: hypothetical protein COW64_08515 [bacterium (Candidatus Blackallbacteria) CG18_big_fil_WC_8_21_14_2_50_49_26]PIW15735.1 MAG: hypothetical protein COW36_16150 [bacterium (Candidatus Blackallbacteria) CG17_big_fil_post_rev_8_21_14_2_50_48_46]PIW49237.1 MAG: hypothetical protein COW20_06660 [bacterium (Candidatus Blackallbacteria) CG13_big_fil_rev_8_21_14_2_50_49_14]